MNKKKPQQSPKQELSIIAWFKRIGKKLSQIHFWQKVGVGATILSVVAGFIYFLVDIIRERPAQMNIEYHYIDEGEFKERDVSDISNFVGLVSTYNRSVSMGIYSGLIYDVVMPVIVNNESKAIYNLELTATIYYYDLAFNPNDIDSKFEIESHDTINHSIILRYKSDHLNPGNKLQAPIQRFFFPDTISSIEDKLTQVLIFYAISYEGLKKIRYIQEWYKFCFDTPNRPSNERIDIFLSGYKDACVQGKGDEYFVTISGDSFQSIIDLPNKCSEEKFEAFKKECIANLPQ